MFASLAALFRVGGALMEGGNMLDWAKKHPYATGGIVFAVGLAVWFLFFRGSGSASTSSADPTQTNLAAAYYAAEAAQTTAGTQLQLATVQANAQTAMATTQANTAAAIAQTQADMTTTLGQQSADVQNHLADTGLLATYSNNETSINNATTAAYYGYQTATAANQAQLLTTAMNTIIPQEIAAQGPGGTVISSIPGLGTFNLTKGQSPDSLRAAGYSPAQMQAIWGFPAA